MFDRTVDRIVEHLRAPVRIDPALDDRVMAEIATLPAPVPARPVSAWLGRRLAPVAALAIAATLLILIGRPAFSSKRKLQFEVVAPQAASVALVGDFNDWDAARTPMRPLRADGAVWSAVVPLAPGRYHYAFLVNGSRWLPDPAAPAASDDGFGAPSSVVTVSGT